MKTPAGVEELGGERAKEGAERATRAVSGSEERRTGMSKRWKRDVLDVGFEADVALGSADE